MEVLVSEVMDECLRADEEQKDEEEWPHVYFANV